MSHALSSFPDLAILPAASWAGFFLGASIVGALIALLGAITMWTEDHFGGGSAWAIVSLALWGVAVYLWHGLAVILLTTLGVALVVGTLVACLAATDKDNALSALLAGVGLAGSSVLLWWVLAPHLWRGLLVVVLIVLGVATAFAAAFAVNARTRVSAGWAVMSAALWFGVVAFFAGAGFAATIPGRLGQLLELARSVPWAVWVGALVATALVSLILNPGLRAAAEAASSRGSTKDTSHAWTDYRGMKWGAATRQEVYDHYHGRGSWYAMLRFWSAVGKVAAVVVPVVLPLAVIHLVGWHDVFSASGVLLTTVLAAAASAGAWFGSRRW